MKTLVGILVLGVSLAVGLFGQTTSVAGTVADPTGAVIPKAVVSVTNTQTGAKRSDTSDSQGRYTIPQLTPGTYNLTAQVVGFNDVTIQRIELLVNTPATVNVTFDKVGSTTTSVQVEGTAAQLNTTDATLGNVITSTAIVELPSFARSVANLLSFQPGVAFFGIPPSSTGVPDDRNGSVNGGRSDQSNITLDGADVNQQNDRAAFSTVLRVTPATFVAAFAM